MPCVRFGDAALNSRNEAKRSVSNVPWQQRQFGGYRCGRSLALLLAIAIAMARDVARVMDGSFSIVLGWGVACFDELSWP